MHAAAPLSYVSSTFGVNDVNAVVSPRTVTRYVKLVNYVNDVNDVSSPVRARVFDEAAAADGAVAALAEAEANPSA